MQRGVKIGSISWINDSPNPIWFSGKAAVLDPDWVPKTYMGLAATANTPPPASLTDFSKYQSDGDFRALMFCHLQLDIDDTTQRLTSLKVIEAIHDPGWTPPFKVRNYPLSGLRFWDSDIWSNKWHAGEASPISVVRTEARHPNSALGDIPSGETVLVDGLIKFRAGAHTDKIGIESVGAPFHVPWVWCEMALTYAAGNLKLYGRGSVFPTHTWYLDDNQVMSVPQVSDSSFPSKQLLIGPPAWVPIPAPRISVSRPLTIDVERLNLYPVLSKGASDSGPQTSLDADKDRKGVVTTHPNTVAGGSVKTHP